AVADSRKAPLEVVRLFPQRTQCLVLDAVLPLHLLHEQLRVGDDFQLGDAELRGLRHAGHETSVLRDVVRRAPDCLAVCGEHVAVLRLEHVTERGGPGIAARSTVRRQTRLHGSTSGYRSKATSSYGCAASSASTTSRTRSAGTTVSTRSSATRSSRPASPTDGVASEPPRNVPVPAVYQEQRS